MILLLAAFAHQPGGGTAHHALNWTLLHTGSQIEYRLDLPTHHDLAPDQLRAIQRGLVLSVDQQSRELRHQVTTQKAVPRGRRIRMTFAAEHPSGVVEVSNGNFPDIDSSHRTHVMLGMKLDSTPIVREHQGRTVRLITTEASRWTHLNRRLHGQTIRELGTPTPTTLGWLALAVLLTSLGLSLGVGYRSWSSRRAKT